MDTKKWKVEKGLIADIQYADDGLGEYSATYIEVIANMDKHLIYGRMHYSIGRNSWTELEGNERRIGNFAGKVKRSDLIEETERMEQFEKIMEAQR